MTTDGPYILPDGSAFMTASFPLPKTHWLYQPTGNPPMTMRIGTADPRRADLQDRVRAAAKYAIKGATMSGKDEDFDPDALIQNLIVGLFGYHTPDGLSELDEPLKEIPPLFFGEPNANR